MGNYFSLQQALAQIGTVRFADIVDIVMVAVLFYFIISLIRTTQTFRVFMGIVVIMLALWISGELQLYTVNYLLRNAVQIGLLALVVLFQPEIRRFLERIGNGMPGIRFLGGAPTSYTENAITQTVLACTDLSRTRTGALIIFERENRLDDQIRTGTILDAEVTAELLKNIFYPKAPLHDGAAIIRGGRIQAGGCMLPLSENTNLSRDLGMRHRAGIGMSEASDALVVIVSEETGAISVAEKGMLKRHLTRDTFEKLLRQGLITGEQTPNLFPRLLRKDKGPSHE